MKATNFNTRVDKTTAIILIKIEDGISFSCADILRFEVMCKEYGDDDDWIGVTNDDIETIEDDDEYQTFELWGTERPILLGEKVTGYSVRAWKYEFPNDTASIISKDIPDNEAVGFGIYCDTAKGWQSHVIDLNTREQAQHIADTLTELLNTLPE